MDNVETHMSNMFQVQILVRRTHAHAPVSTCADRLTPSALAAEALLTLPSHFQGTLTHMAPEILIEGKISKV